MSLDLKVTPSLPVANFLFVLSSTTIVVVKGGRAKGKGFYFVDGEDGSLRERESGRRERDVEFQTVGSRGQDEIQANNINA